MEKRILIIGSEGFIGKHFILYYIKHYDAIEKLYMVDILDIKKKEGPILLLIKIKMGSRSNLKRPDKLPKEYKEEFIKYLADSK